MIAAGIILFTAAVVLSTDIVLANSGHTDIMIMGQPLSIDIWGLFALGAASGVVVVAGLQLIAHGHARAGQRRERRHRRGSEVGTAAPPSAPNGSEPEQQRTRPSAGPHGWLPARAADRRRRGSDAGTAAPSSASIASEPEPARTRPLAGPYDRVVARVGDGGRRGSDKGP